MEVTYALELVLEMMEEMGFQVVGQLGSSLALSRSGHPRRLIIPLLREIPEYILIDNAEDARVLDEFYLARDKIIARLTS